MRFGSLFAGIGGLDLGLERAGMSCAFQVEWDDYCQRVLAKHWPDVPRWGDIREVKGCDLPAIDLLAGGFPCQPHSLAGKRKASQDERDLWGEFARLIRETRPRWVLAENVPGLLSSESGRFFGRVLRDLAELGFDAEWRVLSAAGMGAPHIRRRVFLVAYAHGQQLWDSEVTRAWSEGPAFAPADGSPQSLAHADSERRQERHSAAEPGSAAVSGGRDVPRTVGDAHSSRQLQPQRGVFQERGWIGNPSWWGAEPAVGRVADGVPHRMDRLRALGNAVVPQCAEYVGRLIMAAEHRA